MYIFEFYLDDFVLRITNLGFIINWANG